MKNFDCHVISNTHWDREWRYPFQSYRMDLVDMLDSLLDILETRTDYRAFFLDSQTIVLEDYLEVRPESEERIRRQVQADRLQIGPWYTLPDQWGCPGEALVRNLLRGHQSAKRFGHVTKVGYTPFSNGQVSQLPQLYQEFGIDSCFFYRGISKAEAKSEFIWEGADGTRVFGFKFGDFARYNYYYLVYRPGLLGRDFSERDYQWNAEDVPYHVATEQKQDRQYGWLYPTFRVHREKLPEALEEVRVYTAEDATTSQLLYMMGHDHSFAAGEEVDLIDAAAKVAARKGDRLFHGALPEYMEAFRREARDLQLLTGEMRHTLKEGRWTTLMALILSSRLYLKQRNAFVNSKVLFGAEPLAFLASAAGAPYPKPFLDIAWKNILINQAHDAIGGCSVDQVHEEMMVRWNDCETIADEICRRSMRDMLRRIDGSRIDKRHLQLTLFNPLPRERGEIIPVIIDLPHARKGTLFSAETVDGKPVEVQITGREDYTPTVEGPLELTMPLHGERLYALLNVEGLPALGHDAVVIKPGKTPHCGGEALVKDERTLENEFLKVVVNSNGTLSLTDKITGKVRENLCCLEDTAEFGDPWNRVLPEGDSPILSHDCQAKISVVREGSLEGTIKAEFTFTVPEGKEEAKRSDRMVELPICLYATLRRGSRALEVRIDMENRARDHRLRVLLPSGVQQATHSIADGQYDVLRRPITLPDPSDYKEPPYPTNPMWNFVAVNDGREGFAVLNNGLIEYEVCDDEERTVAITLLRAFGKFIYERPTPGSQCLRPLSFKFLVYPFTGEWEESELLALKERFTAPIQAIASAPTRGEGALRKEFLRLDPPSAAFGAIKRSEEDPSLWILRCANMLEREQTITVCSGLPVKEAMRLTLEELPIEPLCIDNDTIRIVAGAKKIITLGLRFAQT